MAVIKREPVSIHPPHIHPTAIVHPGAGIGRGVEIGPYCLVGERVKLGDGTRLLSHVIIHGHTTIGRNCEIHPFSILGGTSQDKKYHGETSYVRIGDRNTIRAYVTVDRGTGEGSETVLGDDNLLLAYVHVAHNCRIGSRVIMSNLSQLAGHVVVGDAANIGGMVGVHQFVRIGRMAMVGGKSKVVKDIPPFMLCEGSPTAVRGLNKEGLKRNRLSEAAVSELKEAFRVLYRTNRTLASALAELRPRVATLEGKDLLAFFEESSERGILKR